MLLQPLPAFTDNYIWTLRDSPAGAPVVVDPGDAAPVLAWADGLRGVEAQEATGLAGKTFDAARKRATRKLAGFEQRGAPT